MQAAEISEAYYQQGPYQLKNEYDYLECDPNDAPAENIENVEEMKRYLHEALQDDSNDTPDKNVGRAEIQKHEPSVAKIAELLYTHVMYNSCKTTDASW
jgi:hypothetical protein